MSKEVKDVEIEVIGWSDRWGMYDLDEFNLNNGVLSVASKKFELIQDGRERVFRYDLVARHLRWLQGEVLTVIDATIDDAIKRQAVKDLIKDKFSAKISWLYELCGKVEGQLYDDEPALQSPEDSA